MKGLRAFGMDFVGTRRRIRPVGWLTLLVGIVAAGAVALDWKAAEDEASLWAGKARHWRQLVEPQGGHRTTVRESEELQSQMAAAAKAVDRLATPWGALYGSLEDSVDDTVTLLAISPNVEKSEVHLNGEAKDFTALRAYIKRLGESQTLGDVRLLAQEVKQSDAQRPIVFSIVAAWRKTS